MSASPAPWAVSSEKGAFYIHPDGSPGVVAKVYRRDDARLIRAAPELYLGALRLLGALEQGDGEACGAAERDLWRAVRRATRGPP